MKITHLLIPSLLLTLILSCSSDKKGCTNYWAKNYKEVADEDCCCKYDTEEVIEKVVGNYKMKTQCNSGYSTYLLEIKGDPDEEEGILVQNLYNDQQPLSLKFNEGKFIGETEYSINGCLFVRSISLSPTHTDVICTFDQRTVNGDCGFEIDIYCNGVAERL